MAHILYTGPHSAYIHHKVCLHTPSTTGRRRPRAYGVTVSQRDPLDQTTTCTAHRARALGLWLVWCAALGACNQPAPGSARFEVDGVQPDYQTCLSEAFPFDANFSTARYRQSTETRSSTSFIHQRAGTVMHNDDLIYFEIFERDAMTAQAPAVDLRLREAPVILPSTPKLLEDLDRPGPRARGNLIFKRTCPQLADSLLIEGTLTFERLDDRPGGRIVGALTNGRILSAYTGAVVAERLTGEFDYPVEHGPPFQDPPFPAGARPPGPQ